MDRNEPDRPSFTAFVKAMTDCKKSNRLDDKMNTKQTWRNDSAEEVTVQGVAILSDN